MSYIWPIALVVVFNIVYRICAKAIPKQMDVTASMTVTRLAGGGLPIYSREYPMSVLKAA